MPYCPSRPARPCPPAPGRFSARRRAGVVVASALCLAIGSPIAGPAGAVPDAPVSVTSKIASAEQRLQALGTRIEATVEQYNSARLTLASTQRRAAAATAAAEQARRVYLAKRAMLSRYAAFAYRSGDGGALAAMLTSTPADYLDGLATLDAVARRQTEILTAAASARQQYAAQVAAVRAAAAAATRVTEGIAATRTSIEAQIADQRRQVATLRAEADRLRALAARQPDAAPTATRLARRVSEATGTSPVKEATPPAPPASGRAKAAVAAAYSVLGRPYVWGAAGPGSFDCSGLTMWSWAHAGVSLPHSSRAQYGSGARVSKSALQPGDLLFFYSPISHVGMYVGGGRMIAAPNSGSVVRLSTPQWGSFVGAVRPG